MRELTQLAVLLHAGAAIVSVAFFTAARPPAPVRLEGRGGLQLALGRWAYWATGPLLRAAAALGVPPSALTVLGMLLCLAAGAAAAAGSWGTAGLLLLWSAACDLLDGELARTTGTTHPAGAFLDSTLDRVGEIGLLLGIAAGLHGRTEMLAAGAAMAASLMVSYARARGEGLGISCPSGGLERPHRLAIIIAALLAAAWLDPGSAEQVVVAVCAAVALGAGATAAGRIVAIHHGLRRAEPARSKQEADAPTAR